MNRGLGIILLCAIAFSALMIFHIARNKSFVDSFENKKTGANIKIVIIVVLPLVFMGIVAYVSETTKFGFVSTLLLCTVTCLEIPFVINQTSLSSLFQLCHFLCNDLLFLNKGFQQLCLEG